VFRDEAADEYGKPVEFFRRTFLTDGLRDLLLNATRRWRRDAGDPVVELQTNFGGGKTHSMIALYHLAQGYKPADLPGVEAMLAEAQLEAAPVARTAVLVGQMISPAVVHAKPDGTQVRTLWGELAWQLGGAEGYAMVAEADAVGTSPGSALVDLFKAYAPCLVLIDEWVAYARLLYGVDGLPAGSFDAQFTFAQALAEAARAVPGTLLVVSIPASDIEVGGDGGKAALERLKNVIGRVESSWRPASAEEGFEIVRRRLFDDMPAEHAPERDAVVKAFGELYRTQKGEFPAGAGEGDYERRIAAAYPIHPELFDRLYGEWSTLDKFQRTRGVLRLMAAVVHELWERGDNSLLVMPASIPIDAQPVSAELTRYLEDGWTPVIESDIDGPNALPLRLDRENPNLGRYSATRRVARTIYLGSAPTQHAANRGLDDRAVKLGCVQPGEAPATFGDALRRLSDQATYLYADGQRYWYSLAPTVTRLAHDRAAQRSDDDVDAEIRRRVQIACGDRGDFVRVHATPTGPGDVADDPSARLVVLGPEAVHSSKSADSRARALASTILEERAGGPRLHRNMLLFLAPDASRLDDLRQAVRQYLAWASIDAEHDTLGLDAFQRNQSAAKRGQFDDAATQRIGETYVWLLVPGQARDAVEVTWDESRVTGNEPLAMRASRKLRTDEGLITGFSGVRLRLELDRIPLWRGDDVDVKQLWSDLTQYLYLPRLRDVNTLLEAVRDGLALLTWNPDTFVYAQAHDADSGLYRGLIAGQADGSIAADGVSVLVRPEVAAEQLVQAPPPGGDGGGEGPEPPGGGEQPVTGDAGLPRRFYGRASLDSMQWVRDLTKIAENVIAHLQRTPGATVEFHLEIEALAPDGFPDEVRRTVSENATTLKLDSHEFEAE
jgi:hypothetical protein